MVPVGSLSIHLVCVCLFWLCWVSVAAVGLLSSCSACGLFFVAVHGLVVASGFSLWSTGARVQSFSSRNTPAQKMGHHGFIAPPPVDSSWTLGSNPALAGGFVSTEPPGRPSRSFRKIDSQTLPKIYRSIVWILTRFPGDSWKTLSNST